MREQRTSTTRWMATVGVALLVATSFAGVGMGLATMGADGVQDDGEAQLRVAHLSPDAPAVDVLVDNETVLEGAEYRDVSDYLSLSEGEHAVTIQTSEDEQVVFDDNVTLEADTNYTAAALGSVENDTFEVALFEDDFEAPSQDESSVRLIHASPDAPAVDVTVAETDTTLFENASFGNATDYETVPAGEYELEIRPAGEEDADPVTTVNVTLENGTVHSAIAVGYLSPDEAPVDEEFEVLLVTDMAAEGMMETTPGEEMGNETTTEEM